MCHSYFEYNVYVFFIFTCFFYFIYLFYLEMCSLLFFAIFFQWFVVKHEKLSNFMNSLQYRLCVTLCIIVYDYAELYSKFCFCYFCLLLTDTTLTVELRFYNANHPCTLHSVSNWVDVQEFNLVFLA